ncbi:hypothetical protein GM415_03585 [Pseudodesulfovibrio cashew]|uniref:Uncharacterized protein n=1 Tax=Pseudodesulfovibrio cashew TaxID=2678688 RepID=A0A6I6JAZ6_9BACT|nr:hypothetical protein [Pseudodesulfovibrio cashew]QGY39241.1 hypothetical protein GM415_03585 [Pseudodesulfovibrio cashew]
MRRVNKLLFAGGIVNSFGGVLVAFAPTGCWYGYCWNQEAYNVPLGIGIACLGLVMLVASLRKGQRDYGEMYICSRCETALPFAEVPDEQCPHCHIPMEPLKGFYTRHPELKKD